MDPWMWRPRLEAQHIVVRYIVRDRYQMPGERCCVFEGNVLASRQVRHGLGHLPFETVFCGQERHPRQSQWWRQIAKNGIKRNGPKPGAQLPGGEYFAFKNATTLARHLITI